MTLFSSCSSQSPAVPNDPAPSGRLPIQFLSSRPAGDLMNAACEAAHLDVSPAARGIASCSPNLTSNCARGPEYGKELGEGGAVILLCRCCPEVGCLFGLDLVAPPEQMFSQ